MVEAYDRVLLWYFPDRFLAYSKPCISFKTCLILIQLDILALLYMKKDYVGFHLDPVLLYGVWLVRDMGLVWGAQAVGLRFLLLPPEYTMCEARSHLFFVFRRYLPDGDGLLTIWAYLPSSWTLPAAPAAVVSSTTCRFPRKSTILACFQRCFRGARSLSRGNLVVLLGLFNSTDFQ